VNPFLVYLCLRLLCLSISFSISLSVSKYHCLNLYAQRTTPRMNNASALRQITMLGVGKDSGPVLQSQNFNNIAYTHFGVSCADPMKHERIDESRCYFCGFDKNCDLCTQTHYTLCLSCRNTNPTQGWWGSNDKDIHLDSVHGSRDNADVFEAEGCDQLHELTSDEVSKILMSNPDRTMPAKRGKNVVSINSRTKYLKHEPPAVQKWAEMKWKRAKRENNQRKALKTSAANTPTITSMLKLLVPGTETEDNMDTILDDALTDYGTALNARVDDCQRSRYSLPHGT
jgi:hypothetical protein